jgi:SWI/SNF-related matrix-associated actin-dependent regulator of chromatin subfamily A-like protein 1
MSLRVIPRDFGYEFYLSPNYATDAQIIKLIRALPGESHRQETSWFIKYHSTGRVKTQLDEKVVKTERKINKIIQERIENLAEQFGETRDLPDLTVSLPVRRPLYPYQGFGVAYCLKHKRVIIGDKPGLGKTSQAAAVLLAGRVLPDTSTLPALIICPSTIKRKWQKELQVVSGLNALVLNDRYKTRWPYLIQSGAIDAVVVNFEGLKKYFTRAITTPDGEELSLKHIQFNENIRLFKTVIIDEVHRCKDATTRQAKLVKGIADGKEWILALTGTPLVNKPYDLASQLSILGRIKDFGGYTYFKNRYCEGGKGASNLRELNYRLTETCYYMREKKDVLKDLPDKTRQVIYCDIDNRAEYDFAEKKFEEYLLEVKKCTDEQVQTKLRGKFMVQLGILREVSARGKIRAVQEWAENLLESGDKVVIFCNLIDIIDRIKKIFPGSLEISGRIKTDDRDRYIELFQTSPNHRLIICNIKAGGVGIDLFASSNVGFIEEPWTGADFEQCEDRLHRNGQKNAVLSTSFLGADTMDDFVHDKIIEKMELSDLVTGTKHEIEVKIDSLLNMIHSRKKQNPSLWQ